MLFEKKYKSVFATLEEGSIQRLLEHPLAADRVQRALLDALAASKKRTFKSTWDYLDSTGVK
jgi:hypothetical protein